MKLEHNGTRVVQDDRIRKEIIEGQLSKDLENLKELPMQGRLVDNKSADYLMSQNIFRNSKLTDELIYILYKARHNVPPLSLRSLTSSSGIPCCANCDLSFEITDLPFLS